MFDKISRYHGLSMGFPHSSVGKKSVCKCRRSRFDSWVRKIHQRRDRLPTPGFLGFPFGSAYKESACNAGVLGLIPGSETSPGEGKGYQLDGHEFEQTPGVGDG